MLKTVLITGAGGGIGAATALLFSYNNWEVILWGRNHHRLKKVAAKLPYMNSIIACDLNDRKETSYWIKKLSQKKNNTLYKGKLVAVVNNAAVFSRKSFMDTEDSDWDQMYETNLMGPVRLIRGLVPILKQCKKSHIINVSSTLGFKPVPSTSAYSALKAGIENLTHCLALELAPLGIRVNSICPGLVETPIHEFYKTKDKKLRKQLNEQQPLGRIGQPEDIASAIHYLCSNEAEWITGSRLTIDGGISL